MDHLKPAVVLLTITLLLTPTAPPGNGAYGPSEADASTARGYLPGEIIIKLRDDLSPAAPSIQHLNDRYGVHSMEPMASGGRDSPLRGVYLARLPRHADIPSIARSYASMPGIIYAEANHVYRGCRTPNDPGFGLQWPLDQPSDHDIDAPEAWDIETGSPNVIIAVIDTGVDIDHPDLASVIWVNSDEVEDGTDTDGNGYIDDVNGWNFVAGTSTPMDDNGHGTHCAGIAGAATDNGVGIAGVCWQSTIMPLKGLDSGNRGALTDLAEAVVYAVDNGADVISMSWGGVFSFVVRDAVRYAADSDVVMTASAGNENSPDPLYPAGYPDVIAVAATNSIDRKASFSNHGRWIDVAAPGTGIYSTIWDDRYANQSGTSMACPHVAGLAGLLRSQDPALSTDEVRRVIRANVDPYESGFYIGTGRINAGRALTRANRQPETPETPTGETSGRTKRTYTYTTRATDGDGDRLSYTWDWGDGTTSEPIGPLDPGEICRAEHAWEQRGTYSVTVIATDPYGGESYRSDPLAVSMPLTRPTLLQQVMDLLLHLLGLAGGP